MKFLLSVNVPVDMKTNVCFVVLIDYMLGYSCLLVLNDLCFVNNFSLHRRVIQPSSGLQPTNIPKL